MNLTDREVELLSGAKDDTGRWNKIVDEIKEKRSGKYPPDWAEKVIFGMLEGKGLVITKGDIYG